MHNFAPHIRNCAGEIGGKDAVFYGILITISEDPCGTKAAQWKSTQVQNTVRYLLRKSRSK